MLLDLTGYQENQEPAGRLLITGSKVNNRPTPALHPFGTGRMDETKSL
jgi:hypothetical protein